MTTITATVQNGVIVPSEPLAWPDGTAVEVTRAVTNEALDAEEAADPLLGTSPEAIARWLALEASTPALVMTDEEWAAWEQRRAEDKAWHLAHRAERDAKIDALFAEPL